MQIYFVDSIILKNRGDVVFYLNKPLTNVCTIELHSFSFTATIRKVAIGIIEILRVVKAHWICECKMIGFVLPKLDVNQCIIKVTVSYMPVKMVFIVKCTTVEQKDFQNEFFWPLSTILSCLISVQRRKYLTLLQDVF